MASTNPRVEAQVDHWLKRLIDLSRRNRLLYFRETRRGTLALISPSPGELFDTLVNGDKTFSIWVPEPGRLDTEEDGDDGDDILDKSAIRRLGLVCSSIRTEDAVETAESNPKELGKTLRRLSAKAILDLEERGVRILHVAFGMLDWDDIETGQSARSPILMVPVELVRDSRNDPWRLAPCDEDIVLNPVLAVKLQRELGLTLPEVPTDWGDLDLKHYLDQVAGSIGKTGWSVADKVWLGLFSFHKLPMYQDLHRNRQKLSDHPVVARLSGVEFHLDHEQQTVVQPQELDGCLDPKDSFLVVDADSSQLAAIETVKLGTNLVLHGPPGTGKSQTITNVVAEMLAAGKTVLFVSEKMAALEVVYRRIEEAHLGHKCLEIHSHKASRRSVVTELRRAMQERVLLSGGVPDADLARLAQRRAQLNDYVAALHEVRQPLGMSVREALVELAVLRVAEEPAVDREWAAAMDSSGLDWLIGIASHLTSNWWIVLEGDEFPWYGFLLECYDEAFLRRLPAILAETSRHLEEVAAVTTKAAAAMGIGAPKSLAESQVVARLAEVLERRVVTEAKWLRQGNGADVAERLATARAKHLAAREQRGALDDKQGEAFVSSAEARHSDALQAVCTILADRLGISIGDGSRVADVLSATRWVCGMHDAMSRTIELAGEVAALLGVTGHRMDLRRVEDYVNLAVLCLQEPRPIRQWLSADAAHTAVQEIAGLRASVDSWRVGLAELEGIDDSLLSMDVKAMLARYKTEHRRAFAWLRSSYRTDARALASCAGRKVSKGDALRLLATAVEVNRARRAAEADGPALLGRHYAGLSTDFVATEAARKRAARAIELLGSDMVPEVLARTLCDGLPDLQQLTTVYRDLRNTIPGMMGEAENPKIGPIENLTCDGRELLVDIELGVLEKWLAEVHVRMVESLSCLEEIYSAGETTSLQTVGELGEDIAAAIGVRKLETWLAEADKDLAALCGPSYSGWASDWDELIAGALWAAEVTDLLGALGDAISEEFIAGVTSDGGKPTSPAVHHAELRDAVTQAYESIAELEGCFESGQPSIQEMPLQDVEFDALKLRLQAMQDGLSNLDEWVDICKHRRILDRAGLSGLAASLWSSPPPTDQLVDCVRAAVLRRWVRSAEGDDARLADFRVEDHERVLDEFQRLDRQQWAQGAPRVVTRAEGGRVTPAYVPAGSERDLLLREAMKKRRHLPIRHLFERIPNLLLELKPCLLMSPLSVSQFLSPDMVFDLVVFDEASQICSEDAVGAIYRGRQVLICGDQRQLPPTDFFQKTIDDDLEEDVEPEEANIDVFESVLDECLANGLRESWLRWHYRSRHENLIAFSNHSFYDYRLVTFPAATGDDDWLGVHFVHVPEGVYDRGGKRTNEPEARTVAETVIGHLRDHPTKSIGVVSFSVAQTQAIDDELERRAARDTGIDNLLQQGRDNGFFVKNLENVQGDERDVMVFSIGYGRDRQGRLTMNFGPLNQAGGERRLNVAVTRARERVMLVSSIRAADIDPSQSQAPGVRHLHTYLNFAERGGEVLDALCSVEERDYESPLEREVADAIRQMGYDVVPQVGCSSFRVDLGVRVPGVPGRFILGVECDGATYHSGHTARDRDRLRQDILEDLGWRIHRIWSPAWIQRQGAEVDRLREALETAERQQGPALHGGAEDPPGWAVDCSAEIVQMTPAPREQNGDARPGWTETYVPCQVDPCWLGWYEFHDPACREEHVRCIGEIVAGEGPVHIDVVGRRLAAAWGLQRVGQRMRDAIERAANTVVGLHQVDRKGDFLWPTAGYQLLAVRVPDAVDQDSQRKLEHIPPEEITLAMQQICHDGSGVERKSLISETARVFGVHRVGHVVRELLERILTRAVQNGDLIEAGGTLTRP